MSKTWQHCSTHGGYGFIRDCIECKGELPASRATSTAPWMMPPLNEWAIVGMNHYHVDGERRLFVSMAKDGRCIKSEGADDEYLWNRLWHQAIEQ